MIAANWLKINDPVDPSWWRPLEELAVKVAGCPGLPPVDPDDFLYAARIELENAPVLHVYRHVLTRRNLYVDEGGGIWRYVGRRGGADRYLPVQRLLDALLAAELDRAEQLAHRTRRGPRARPAVPEGDVGGEESPAPDGEEAPTPAPDDEDARAVVPDGEDELAPVPA